jgi:putative hydrolase of the HAD superfamily
LLDLDAQGYRVSLYTAGDEAIQIKKCVDAGIWWMLHEITAVERKDARTLRDYLRDRNISPAQTWMIGNSPKADMLPALSVGIPPHQCILLESYTWEADHAALPAGVARVRRLDQIPSLIAATRRVSELV